MRMRRVAFFLKEVRTWIFLLRPTKRLWVSRQTDRSTGMTIRRLRRLRQAPRVPLWFTDRRKRSKSSQWWWQLNLSPRDATYRRIRFGTWAGLCSWPVGRTDWLWCPSSTRQLICLSATRSTWVSTFWRPFIDEILKNNYPKTLVPALRIPCDAIFHFKTGPDSKWKQAVLSINTFTVTVFLTRKGFFFNNSYTCNSWTFKKSTHST